MKPEDAHFFLPGRLAARDHGPLERDIRQRRVRDWVERTFGASIQRNVLERVKRVLEETLELAQAEGITSEDAHKLVDYVFGREPGYPPQEVGGVGVTLLAYCSAKQISADACELAEVTRILSKPPKVFRDRNQEKAEAGVGTVVSQEEVR